MFPGRPLRPQAQGQVQERVGEGSLATTGSRAIPLYFRDPELKEPA